MQRRGHIAPVLLCSGLREHLLEIFGRVRELALEQEDRGEHHGRYACNGWKIATRAGLLKRLAGLIQIALTHDLRTDDGQADAAPLHLP